MSKLHSLTDHNICYFCGLTEPDNIKKGFRKLVEYHHIVERNQGGSNEDINKVPCCSTCHSKVHLGLIKIDKWYNYGYKWKLHWWSEEKEYYGSFKEDSRSCPQIPYLQKVARSDRIV